MELSRGNRRMTSYATTLREPVLSFLVPSRLEGVKANVNAFGLKNALAW
jgi:hypothetical protein